MLCENCGKNEATIYFQKMVGDQVQWTHLCTSCAKKLGYGDLFSAGLPLDGTTADWQDFLGGLFSQAMPKQGPEEKVCSSCGTTFKEFTQSALAGCPNCYRTFYNELLPSIERIHGNTHHEGKIPKSASREILKHREAAAREQQIDQLNQELEKAVSKQAYEHAAELRDQIKAIKQKGEKA